MSKQFKDDLDFLLTKLNVNSTPQIKKELQILRNKLLSLNQRNRVKINHSIMELVCAKYLISAGYKVYVEHSLDNISCDISATKGLGSLIIEIETGFVPPEHALDPITYCKARIVSKITRYSSYAEKFCLGGPPHYIIQIPHSLIKPPRNRTKEEIKEIKSLCDTYYKNPPVTYEEIRNARLHAIYIIDVEKGITKETDPNDYLNKSKDWKY